MRFFNHYDRIKLFLVFSLAASLPFHIHISSLLILASALLTLIKLYHFKDLKFQNMDKLSLGLVFYFCLEIIGIFYTDKENLDVGLSTLEKHQALVLIPLIFFDFTLNEKNRKKIFSIFIASCFIGCLFCFLSNVQDSLTAYGEYYNQWGFSHDRLSEPIGIQAVYFALYLSLCVLMILTQLAEEWKILTFTKRTLLIFLAICFFSFTIALGARTMTVALMLGIIVNLFYYALKYKAYKFLVIAAFIPLIFAGFILLNPVVRIRFIDLKYTNIGDTNYGSYFARLNTWKPGMEVIKENFWLGVGTGDHQTELNKKYKKYDYQEGLVFNFNMHNQYLQTLLTHGIIGLGILLIIIIFQFKTAILTKDLLYGSFIFLFALGCLTESMLNRNKGIIFFLVLSYIFFKSRKKNH